MSWSKLSLDALADKVGQIFNKRFDRKTENHFKRAYLMCAESTNPQIHASIFAIFNRMASGGEQYTFKPSQDAEADMALSTAHGLMTLVADTQDRYFKLDLHDRLQQFNADALAAWRSDEIEG